MALSHSLGRVEQGLYPSVREALIVKNITCAGEADTIAEGDHPPL